MQVHQHVQPLGALHAQRTVHTGLLRSAFPQRPRAVPHKTRCAHIVHNALVLLRRVAVPHALGLPQGHAVPPCLSHRLAPAAVPAHQLCLRRAGFVHRVLQLVQLRVFVPQLAVAVGRPVQHLARQRFRQRLRLAHVRALGLQVLHQHLRLVCQLRPVSPAAVGAGPPHCQPLQAVPAYLHTPGQSKELSQRVQRRRLVRNGSAGLPLVAALCLPVCLLRQRKAHIRHLVKQRRPCLIVPDLVQLHRHPGILQLLHQCFACIVRQYRCSHLVKAHRTLRLCLKVSGRYLRHILVQRKDPLCCVLADHIIFLCKRLADGCGRVLSLCCPQQDLAKDLLFLKAVVAVRRRFLPQHPDHLLDLAVRILQQLLVLRLRHLLQPSLVRPHLVQVLILCRGRAHQGACRYAPHVLSARILAVHSLHQILQRVGVVQLCKAPLLSARCNRFFFVSDALFSQHTLQLVVYPLFHLLLRRFFPYRVSGRLHIQRLLSGTCIGHHFVCVLQHLVQPPSVFIPQLVDPQHPPFVLPFQRSVGVLLLQGIRSRVRQLVQPVNIPAFKRLLELCLARVPDHSLQRIVSNAVKLFLFHPVHRLHRYSLVLQVCQLHPGVPLHLLRQFLPAQAACLVHTCTLHRSAVHKLSVKCLPACLIHPVFKVPHGIVVHLVLHARPCRGPRIRAVHPVCLVHHGVNGVAAKYQRYRPVLRVPLPGLHHRNGRRRHPAQLQRLAQVLLGQVVHRHQLLLAVHLHRRTKRKAHCFLHSCIVFLVFASILCYTCSRRYLLGILCGAQHRPRELCGGIFFFCYHTLIIEQNMITICPTYFMHIKRFSSIFKVCSYDNTFIDFLSIHFNRCSKNVGIKTAPHPVFLVPDLCSFLNHFRNRRNSCLLCFAIAMANRLLCIFTFKLNRSKAFTNHAVTN